MKVVIVVRVVSASRQGPDRYYEVDERLLDGQQNPLPVAYRLARRLSAIYPRLKSSNVTFMARGFIIGDVGAGVDELVKKTVATSTENVVVHREVGDFAHYVFLSDLPFTEPDVAVIRNMQGVEAVVWIDVSRRRKDAIAVTFTRSAKLRVLIAKITEFMR